MVGPNGHREPPGAASSLSIAQPVVKARDLSIVITVYPRQNRQIIKPQVCRLRCTRTLQVIVGPQERAIAQRTDVPHKLTEKTSWPTSMDLLRPCPRLIAKSTRSMQKPLLSSS